MRIVKLIAVLVLMAVPVLGKAQESIEVFLPIAKYLEQGDAEKLSAWFDDHLEISVNGVTSDSGRNQARQIMKSFFENVHPTSFSIQHTASKANMKYALGVLSAGSTNYNVTIFVNYREDGYRIQQLRIEKLR